MPKPKLIITNVGNTLWRKVFNDDSNYDSKRLWNEVKNKKLEELCLISPEINSLTKFKLDGTEKLVFITTNTSDSIVCGEVIIKYYQNLGYSAERIVIENFKNTKLKAEFEKGISEYVDTLINTITKYTYSHDKYINVTSGFRSLISYATIIGTVFKCHIFYLYEWSTDLKLLPPFPIDLNTGIFKEHDEFFRKLDNDLIEKEQAMKEFGGYENLQKLIPEILWEEDGMIYLTNFGRILWRRFDSENPLVFISKDVEKALSKSDELRIFLKKFLRGEGESDHHLHTYVGKAKCWKFPAENWRIFYIEEPGKPKKVAQILKHDDYEKYIKEPRDETKLQYKPIRIKI